MGKLIGDRAVVLGGSMAGLLAARVLSEAYAQVLVVDRDRLLGVTSARRGVPQGRHVHGLLARGQQIIEELFPGFTGEMVADGVPLSDLSDTVRWYFNGRRLASAPSGLTCVAATRPRLERQVRTRVAALANVSFAEECDIAGLTSTLDRTRVTGVRVWRHATGAEETIEADLVVDATGRGSRTPGWLAELGYARPTEDRVKIDLSYTTRRYRLPADEVFGRDVSINPVSTPSHPRGAFFTRIEDGFTALSLTGVLGDSAPTDPDGFLEWCRSLPVPEIYRAVRDAEPLDDPVSFRYPASFRRHYERLERFPERLLVLGDAACSFNPVYGQGMTVAALESLTLREHLRRGVPPRPLEFLKDISDVIEVPWGISAGGDLSFPDIQGARPLKVRAMNGYMAKLQAAATRDGSITRTFMRVAGLVEPPQALMRPGMLVRVLRNARRPLESTSGTPSPDLSARR
ncbi:FAD-dependent oxidoreductase [Amycolatopsis nigrescens]|uniref:FAD-dependent oxidoreductase n=1 Tax=Amycolatopsis nigrescens TaxID=381445 RepID=UPI00036AADFD|nr:FAD-dependent oxidoreductase [Amycolatopsis nigrescens]